MPRGVHVTYLTLTTKINPLKVMVIWMTLKESIQKYYTRDNIVSEQILNG